MKKGRRKKIRYVQSMPEVVLFSPRGKVGRPDEIELKVDQLEAIRIADYQGLDQSQGAEIMGISRSSFGRILREGRKIIADALINGKIIRVRIGDVQVGVRKVPKVCSNSTETLPEEVLRKKIYGYALD